MRCDVVVVGAGLAGLSASRDLAAGGADVILLEARGRAGGRVEQARLPDGRLVQLGGELVGDFHTAYRELTEELGLTIVPGFGGHASGRGCRAACRGACDRQRVAVDERRRPRELRRRRGRVRESRGDRRPR